MAKFYSLIDGSGYIFRAYYALPPMTNPKGTPIGAVYGFCSMLLKVLDEKANHSDGTGNDEVIAVILDAHRKTFRNDIYPDYKANRSETPEELIPQFPLIRKAVEAFQLPCIEQINYEADDLIATYANHATKLGAKTRIISSDKDLMQLINDDVLMYDPMKQKLIGANEVMAKFGVAPNKVIEVQSLIGDSTDNIPGVSGIGPKGAAELIDKYGTLENLLDNAEEIKQPKRRQTLIDQRDIALMSKQLVTLETDVPLDTNIDNLTCCEIQLEPIIAFFEEHGFNSLIPRARNTIEKLNKHNNEHSNSNSIVKPVIEKKEEIQQTQEQDFSLSLNVNTIQKDYKLIRNEAELEKLVKEAMSKDVIAIDTETTGIDSLVAQIIGISIATEEGKSYYIPLRHTDPNKPTGVDLFSDGSGSNLLENQIPVDKALEILKPLLYNTKVKKVLQNAKYDLHIFAREGLDFAKITPVEDTMIMSYVLDGTKNKHNMDELAMLHLNYSTIHFADVCGSGKNQILFSDVELEKALDYAAEDTDITLKLYNIFKERMDKDSDAKSVYENIDLPLVYPLTLMEETGVKIDSLHLKELSDGFEKDIKQLENDIYKLAGVEFNVSSPKQVGDILFNQMELPYKGKKSKTGEYVTGYDVLLELKNDGFEIANLLLKHREISKLKSTYSDALIKQINPRTKRVHTNYFQTGVSTGRLSSNSPNLQNIPIRSEKGKEIRKSFIANKGYKIVSADYSQVELRVMADYAGVTKLKEAFANGIDIHTLTASQVFNLPIDQVDSDTRRSAKAINFGIIYGMSAFGLARNLKIENYQAKEYIDAYFATYPEIRKYMDEMQEFAKLNGYVKTIMGRKIFIRGMTNPRTKSFASRAAINAPIQGSAADIMKLAMIKLPNALKDAGLDLINDVKIMLQVHDELVLEVKEELVEKVSQILKQTMEGVAKLSIPLIVDTGVGENWEEAH